jgi:hypothetical protein
MRIGKKVRFDIVIRKWQGSKIVKQKVISPIYDTTIQELLSLIKKCLKR